MRVIALPFECPAEGRAAEVCLAEGHPDEGRPEEVRAAEVRLVEVRLMSAPYANCSMP
jgi:hypothetical protein